MSTSHALAGDLQKIDVKMALDAPERYDWDRLLAVFGRWRLDPNEEILDLADYLHVPGGPGCLLVSHRWHFGADFANGTPGLFLSTRKGLRGELADRFAGAIRILLEKGRQLLAEPELEGAISLRTGELELVVNDRMLVPDPIAGDELVRPAISRALDRLYGSDEWNAERDDRAGVRLGYRVRAAKHPRPLEELLGRLSVA